MYAWHPRSWILGTALLASVGTTLHAQSVRWNERGPSPDDRAETPTINVWLQGARTYDYGAPVRVWFNVSDDAYVIVARVDANGHLTLLYPQNRQRSAEVVGGQDIHIRGRNRAGATFFATDRMGGGYVFAMASYDPFDLSRLTARDFDRYVTGMYVGRPSRMYVGDPHRVITRFASLVSYSSQSAYDYAVDYYNVESASFVSSSGYSSYSSYCGGYNSGFSSLTESWDDDFYYGARSFAGGGCDSYCRIGSLLSYYSQFGALADPSCLYGQGRGQIAQGPPPAPPRGDSTKVPGWLPDSIRGHRPDTVGTIPDGDTRFRTGTAAGAAKIGKIATVNEGTRRPITVGDDDPSDRSYAIPGRALRNSRLTIGDRRETEGPVGTRQERITATGDDRPDITWVRPPREVLEGPKNPSGEGALPRGPARRDAVDDGDFRRGRGHWATGNEARPPVRDEPSRSEPTRGDQSRGEPSRNTGPRFDSPPPTTRNGPEARAEPRSERPSYSPPPSPPQRVEPVRAAEPPPRPEPPQVREPPTEKKPEKPSL